MKKYLILGVSLFVLCLIVLIVLLPDPVAASTLPSSPVANVFPMITPPYTAPDSPVLEGQDMNYYVGFANSGPDVATNVVLTVELPAGTIFKSYIILEPGVTVTTPAVDAPGIVRATIPVLEPGHLINTYLVITPFGPTRQITFTGTVTTDSTDPNPANNSQTVISYFSAPSFVDSPPAVVSGYGTINGTATPASPCNDPPAVVFSTSMEGRFSDLLYRPLTYHIVSIVDNSPDPVPGVNLMDQVELTGSQLTFMPTSLQANRSFTILVKANNGVADSQDYVSVIITVGSVPPCLLQVDFDAAGGLPQPAAQFVEAGGKITEPGLVTLAGHTFTGWFTEDDPDTPWDFATQTVSEPMTLHAGWAEVEPLPVTGETASGLSFVLGILLLLLAAGLSVYHIKWIRGQRDD
ncbi:MAG TPA: hypothetical protein DCM45_02465 [Clostridiales bacterium]|nr:hypothetical protein [Clostridiales bacterium]